MSATLQTAGALRGSLGTELLERSSAVERVGRLRFVRWLASGGMGEIYLGYDETLGRDVAIKTLSKISRLDPEQRRHLHREARMLARAQHPGICQLHDLISAEEGDYLVMEYLPGHTLAAQPPSPTSAVEIVRSVAMILADLHGASIVHRDIKPDNIMVTSYERVKLLDLGIAGFIGHFRDVAGTTAYMSPEQAVGFPLAPAMDIYALGAVLFEFSTGQRINAFANVTAIRRSRRQIPESLDPDLRALLARMLDLDPAKRPSALEVVSALDAILDTKTQRSRRRGFAFWAATACGFAGAMALGSLI